MGFSVLFVQKLVEVFDGDHFARQKTFTVELRPMQTGRPQWGHLTAHYYLSRLDHRGAVLADPRNDILI